MEHLIVESFSTHALAKTILEDLQKRVHTDAWICWSFTRLTGRKSWVVSPATVVGGLLSEVYGPVDLTQPGSWIPDKDRVRDAYACNAERRKFAEHLLSNSDRIVFFPVEITDNNEEVQP